MTRIIVLVLCTCTYREVQVPEQGLPRGHYDLQPAIQTYVDNRCHKRWEWIGPVNKATAEDWKCGNEYAGLEGCFEAYCDTSKCETSLHIYDECMRIHMDEWIENERLIWLQNNP